MKKYILQFIAILSFTQISQAQVFDVDTIQYAGDANKYINLVVMGDGYTASEQAKFIQDVKTITIELYSVSPWRNYAAYFNVFALKVISNESGAKHPNTATDCGSANVPVSNPDNYFASTFDYGGIHRLIVATAQNKIVAVLAKNFPNYDQVLILLNTPYYGGSGGEFSIVTLDPNSSEITLHEMGHSFANLADEYYAGEVYLYESPNMTKETNPTLVKWKNWMGDNGIGIYKYCCGGTSALWNKPHQNCKMQFLGEEYCSVCSEIIVETIHSFVNPLVSYSPTNLNITAQNPLLDFKLTEIMKPSPNSLKIDWKLDNQIIATNIDSVSLKYDSLKNGNHTLQMVLMDTSVLLRVNNHVTKHFSSVSWTINKDNAGIELLSNENKISYNVFPNPSKDFLNIKIETKNSSKAILQLISADGKIVMEKSGNTLGNQEFTFEMDMQNLSAGNYFLTINLDGNLYTESIIKQ